jgi:hypothetical protein
MTAPMAMAPDPQKAKLYDQLRSKGVSHEDAVAQIEGGGGGGIGRTLGLVGRANVQGLGNMVGLPFAAAGLAYNKVTGNQPPAMLQPQGGAVADQMGLPTPQNAGERIGVAGAEGMAGAAAFGAAGIGPPIAGAMLGGASGVAGQGAAEMGFGPMGQMAASLAVAGSPVLATVGAAAFRSAIAGSEARREAARQSMALLQAGNPSAPVTLGQVAEGGMARSIEGTLRNAPGGSRTFRKTLDAQSDDMAERLPKIADRVGPAGTRESAGAALQFGIKEGFIPRFKAASRHLYERAYRLIGPETPVHLSKSGTLATQQNELAAAARPLSDDIATGPIRGIIENIATTMEAMPGGVPFKVVKELRSRVGAMLDGDELVQGLNLRDADRLYKTLSEDMRTAIAGQGDDALKAWDKATAFYKEGSENIAKRLQPLIDKKEPERAFNALMSGTKDGATMLRQTMRSLAPEERHLIWSTTLRGLGKANPSSVDDFSPDVFFRRWKELSPEAKASLSEATDPSITDDLNRLAEAIALRKDAANVMPNPAGTALNTAAWGVVNGLTGGIVGGMAGRAGTGALIGAGGTTLAVGGSKLAAKVLTNPKIIRWMVKQTKAPLASLPAHLAVLAKQSESWDPESREIAQELSSTLGGLDWRPILLARAVADATARRQ